MMTSSDTLSPLHEHGGSSSAIAADSSTSPSSSLPSSSYGKHGGGGNALHEQQQQQQQPHQQQDEFGSNQQSLSNRNSNNNNRSSIWDRPEEMVVSSHTNKNSQRSSNLGEDAYEHTSRSSQYNKPSDNGSTAYSEFDWDGGSSYHHVGGGGGGGGWDNYHAQHAATTTRQGPPSTQGSVSVEYSRYDADHDIPTFHKRSSARQHGGGGGTTVSNNNNGGGIGNVGDDNDDNNDDSNTDHAVFNGTNMQATFGVCAAATLGGKGFISLHIVWTFSCVHCYWFTLHLPPIINAP